MWTLKGIVIPDEQIDRWTGQGVLFIVVVDAAAAADVVYDAYIFFINAPQSAIGSLSSPAFDP